MNIVAQILTVLVALEFFYIFYRQTIQTTSKQTAELFSFSDDDVANPKVQLLLKNQGIYNALIGVGLLVALLYQQNFVLPILIYIVLVALYGGYSAGKVALFFKQAGLAILTLIALVF